MKSVARQLLQQSPGFFCIDITVEEGQAELSKLCVMELYESTTGHIVSRQLPGPTAVKASLLADLGVKLPDKAPQVGPAVVTRVEMQ